MKRDAQAIYQEMDALAAELKAGGAAELAQTIDHRVHKIAWTSRSELLEELRNVLADALDKSNCSAPIREKLLGGLVAVDREIKATAIPFKPA